jgi:glycosyltransferase involved in cell wall biosynthesis
MGQLRANGALSSAPPPVLISANSFWNIANFRSGLIEALVSAGHRVIIAAPQADARWAQSHGAEVVEIDIDRSGLNPFTDATLWFAYLRLFRRTGNALFLSFTAKPNIYGSLAAHIAGIPSLPNVSGLGTAFIGEGLLSHFVSLLHRLAFRKCPVVFFQNPDDRDLFLDRRIVRPGQAQLLPGSGVDLERFAPSPPTDGSVRFLFVGRLLGDKGVREFVEAAELLRSEEPAWRFQLLGPFDEGNRSAIKDVELRSWIERESVEYLGEAEDVRPHIAAATAVVLPSYREGLPRSLLEAAAMARPLVATDVPGSRRIVQHGVNGLLCAPRDPLSLAEALRQVGLMGAERRAAMGQAGRALVEREYGEHQVVAAYLDALKQLQLPARV